MIKYIPELSKFPPENIDSGAGAGADPGGNEIDRDRGVWGVDAFGGDDNGDVFKAGVDADTLIVQTRPLQTVW